MTGVALAGTGLHGGRAARVVFRRGDGPTRLSDGTIATELPNLTIVRADQGVSVALREGGPEIDLVEHVAAAIGGLGLHEGVIVEAWGGEAPLLDGGARSFADALRSLAVAPVPPRLRVVRPFAFEAFGARYELAPSSNVRVDCEIDFAHPMIGRQRAAWDGDPTDFSERIAPARTFGFVRDAEALRARGRARAVDPDSVVVFDDRRVLVGELRSADEPARHKLLDLVGDLALHGGPPLGIVRAFRPGHRATHALIAEALARGALVRDGSPKAR